MFNHRESLISQHTASWTWHVMPALICLAVVSALFLPRATPSAHAAADLVGIEEAHHATLLVPAAQPGEGEPALVVSHLPQWY